MPFKIASRISLLWSSMPLPKLFPRGSVGIQRLVKASGRLFVPSVRIISVNNLSVDPKQTLFRNIPEINNYLFYGIVYLNTAPPPPLPHPHLFRYKTRGLFENTNFPNVLCQQGSAQLNLWNVTKVNMFSVSVAYRRGLPIKLKRSAELGVNRPLFTRHRSFCFYH